MIELLLLLTSLGVGELPRDTIVELRSGDRLVLEDFRGMLDVEPWDRESMRVTSRGEDGAFVSLGRSGSRLELRVDDRKGRSRDADLHLRVPAWLDLEVEARDGEIRIQGTEGDVDVRLLRGELELLDLAGRVRASAIHGHIDARGLRGTSILSSSHDDLDVMGASGDLSLETVSGDIRLEGAALSALRLTTTSGDAEFSGRLLPGGEHRLHTHSGDLTVELFPPVDLEVGILTYQGEFYSEFPARARGFRSGEELRFTIGDGGTGLSLKTFSGEIRILKGG